MKTFQEFAAENLASFGWTIDPSEIPDWDTIGGVMQPLIAWWENLDEETREIIRFSGGDLTDGLWQVGKLSDFPALYTLLKGNAYGDFLSTLNNINQCLWRAHEQVDEQPADEESGEYGGADESSSEDEYSYQ